MLVSAVQQGDPTVSTHASPPSWASLPAHPTPPGCHRAPCALQWPPTGYFTHGRVCIWRRQWHPTPVLLPGKSQKQRSLVGCSPWDHEESDMTERLHFHFSLSCIGEGNGNPLQCSCLENPRDGGAWWAAVYGVAQSRTRLKWLSSSSSREIILLTINKRIRWRVCHFTEGQLEK